MCIKQCCYSRLTAMRGHMFFVLEIKPQSLTDGRAILVSPSYKPQTCVFVGSCVLVEVVCVSLCVRVGRGG